MGIFPSTMLRGCLVCVICISKSIHSFIFKLCTMIVHTLKMCMHFLFCTGFIIFFSFLMGVELRHFFHPQCLGGCLACVICNSKSIHAFIFKLCIMIVHTLNMCTSYFVRLFHCFFSFLIGVEHRHFFPICPSVRNILWGANVV